MPPGLAPLIHEIQRTYDEVETNYGGAKDDLRGRVALPEAVVSLDNAAWSGRLGRGTAAARASDLMQRDWAPCETARRYLTRIEQALASPKQAMLLRDKSP